VKYRNFYFLTLLSLNVSAELDINPISRFSPDSRNWTRYPCPTVLPQLSAIASLRRSKSLGKSFKLADIGSNALFKRAIKSAWVDGWGKYTSRYVGLSRETGGAGRCRRGCKVAASELCCCCKKNIWVHFVKLHISTLKINYQKLILNTNRRVEKNWK